MGSFRNNNKRPGRNGKPASGKREMHRVTCDTCGKKCEVPFKPTGLKPVHCSDCFRKEGGSSKHEARDYSKEFEHLNARFDEMSDKLDMLVESLEKN